MFHGLCSVGHQHFSGTLRLSFSPMTTFGQREAPALVSSPDSGEGADLWSHRKEGRGPGRGAGVSFKAKVLCVFQNAPEFCYLSLLGWFQPGQSILQLQRKKVKPREGQGLAVDRTGGHRPVTGTWLPALRPSSVTHLPPLLLGEPASLAGICAPQAKAASGFGPSVATPFFLLCPQVCHGPQCGQHHGDAAGVAGRCGQ